jgi:septum formation protein
MIIHLLPRLNRLRIILASQSPRRAQLLTQIGLNYTVAVSNFPENLEKSQFSPAEYVVETARCKAQAIVRESSQKDAWDIIISADTVVVSSGELLEKPQGRAEAIEMLGKISGRAVEVITGVTIAINRTRNRKKSENGENSSDPTENKANCTETEPSVEFVSFSEASIVEFAVLSPEMISSYVDSGEPYDKAGGFGLQSAAAQFCPAIIGCYFNVMGFPLHKFCAKLLPFAQELPEGQPIQ